MGYVIMQELEEFVCYGMRSMSWEMLKAPFIQENKKFS